MFVVVKATVAINVIRDLRRGNLSKKYNLNEFVSIKTTGSWLDGHLRLTHFFFLQKQYLVFGCRKEQFLISNCHTEPQALPLRLRPAIFFL